MNSLFDIYSAKAEYTTLLKDKMGRVLSAAANHDVLAPVVSQYLTKNGFSPKYPDNKNFAVCFSHDLDSLMQASNRINRPEYVGGLKNLLDIAKFEIKSKIKPRTLEINPKVHPKRILDLAKKYGFKSSYFMLALKEGEKDFNYPLKDVSSIISLISSDGHEIGLHGGHEAYYSKKKIAQERNYLTSAIQNNYGYRNHFLRFETPNTWNYLAENKFEYDTTFGFHDLVGFRNGMCHPFRPFNLNKNKYIDIVEVPLIVMDSSLIKYMNASFDNAFEIVKNLIDQIESCNGVFTMLWHNQMYEGENLIFFMKVLDYIKSKDPWMPTTRELVDHYKKEGYFDQMEKLLTNMTD